MNAIAIPTERGWADVRVCWFRSMADRRFWYVSPASPVPSLGVPIAKAVIDDFGSLVRVS
jgi:hypothetical protein